MPNKRKRKSRKNGTQKSEKDGSRGGIESQPPGQQKPEDGVDLRETGAEDGVPFEGIEDAAPEGNDDAAPEEDQEDDAPGRYEDLALEENEDVSFERFDDAAPQEELQEEAREAIHEYKKTFMRFKFAQTHFRESREQRKHAKQHHESTKESFRGAQRQLWYAREMVQTEGRLFDDARSSRIAAIQQFRAARKRIDEAKRRLKRARRRLGPLGEGVLVEQRPVCGSSHKYLKVDRCLKHPCESGCLELLR